MINNLETIVNEALLVVNKASALLALDELRTEYLGKKGVFAELMKKLAELDPIERPKFGQIVNEAKGRLVEAINDRVAVLKRAMLEMELASEAIDVTLPGRGQRIGSLHPVTQARLLFEDFFTRMGFEVAEGPEIEDDFHNFEALNIPKNHPARAMHDTFYLASGNVLRTHTSPVQIRTMENREPPLRIIAPGRVYRCDHDATHSPMFHQLEGLVIDEKVTFGNLKWLLRQFLNYFFGREINYRFNATFFPFTEPSAQIDIEWEIDGEKRWLEVLGCGMVHPNVLEACNIDSKRFHGFAFGCGIDRLAMLKYGIKDIRLLFENNEQFLRQF